MDKPPFPLPRRQLVTIVCEAAIERLVIELLLRHGARGYTITDARGRGARGVQDAAWKASANIRIEVLCDDQVAAAIVSALCERDYDDYGIVLFVSEVGVLRPEKF